MLIRTREGWIWLGMAGDNPQGRRAPYDDLEPEEEGEGRRRRWRREVRVRPTSSRREPPLPLEAVRRRRPPRLGWLGGDGSGQSNDAGARFQRVHL
jgi:hypothetical protein